MSHPAETRHALLDLEQRRQAALVAVDLPTLADIFADDLIHIHSTGLVHTKEQLLRHIERRRGFIAIERGVLEIRRVGELAIMHGPLTNHMRAADGGAIVLTGHVTQLLRQTEQGWKFMHFQLTPDITEQRQEHKQ